MTFTIYASVIFSKVINASFVHSWGPLSGNASAIIQPLTTSWCSILLTVRTNVYVDCAGFPLLALIQILHCSLQAPTVHCTINWLPFPSKWIYSHPTQCCFLFFLLLVWQTIFKCASWVICLGTALAASWWTNLCLRSWCVRRIAIFHVAPDNQLVFDPLSPAGGGCLSMMCWCGIREEDDKKRTWEALKTIKLSSCQNGISSSQHARDTQDEFCWVLLQIAGVSHHTAISNKAVWCYLIFNRDKLQFMTTELT